MAQHEYPLQINLFTGSLHDTRTDAQRKADSERTQPRPQLMFSQRDIAQFGVNPRPQLSLPETATLMLMHEDPRTDEEKERAQELEAQRLTRPLFELPTEINNQPSSTEAEKPSSPPFASKIPAVPKLTAYLELVHAYEVFTQQKQTHGVSTLEFLRLGAALDLADISGLSRGEMRAATDIGTFRGARGKTPALSETLPVTPDPYPEREHGIHWHDEASNAPPFERSTTAPEFEDRQYASSQEPPSLETPPDEPPMPDTDLTAVRLAIYLRLVHLGTEQQPTSEEYPEGFALHLALTVLDAQRYGLLREEIQAALQIGQYRKNQPQKQDTGEESKPLLKEDQVEVAQNEALPTEQLSLGIEQSKRSKLQTYLSLIQTVKTHTRMLVTPTGEHKTEIATFALAQATKARENGLTEGEVLAALAIAASRAGLRPATEKETQNK
jgi:hypothetical protein